MSACRNSREFSEIIKKSRFKDEITKGQITRGMSEQEVKWSWGHPININIYKSGTKKQYVYYRDSTGQSRSYVYFQNGKVSNWQTNN